MGVPVAGEPGPRARAFQVGVDRLAGADLAVLEVGGGQETVRRRAGDPVDVNNAGRVVERFQGSSPAARSAARGPGPRRARASVLISVTAAGLSRTS